MDRPLAGRIALVTGATRRDGIGAAIARELADAGADLFLAFYRAYDETQSWGVRPDEPTSIVEELQSSGAKVEALEVDLAESRASRVLVQKVLDGFGTIDVLVNNAAHSEPGDISVLDAAQLDRHYAVNLRAPALLCAEFVRQRPKGPNGRIINVTSGQGQAPMPGELAYVATKGGLEALTLSLSAELAGEGITVNAVDPGPTDTGWMSKELKKRLELQAPMRRCADAPMRRCADAPMRRCAELVTHRMPRK